MKINILNLIDFEEVNKLLEGFNQATGFVTAILDLDGNILSKSGWRQICTEFHRINPETARNCSISDTVLANKLGQGEKYHFYECCNGLVDVAVPVLINGEHIANLFSGQFFFEQPNRAFFKKQAETYGFNENEYLKALGSVPIVSMEKVKVAMDFLLNMTQIISKITLQKMEQLQLYEALKESEERSRNALDHMLEGCQIIGYDWRYIYLNHTAEIHNRRPNSELLGNKYMDLWPGIENTEIFKIIGQVLKKGVSRRMENEFLFPDGSIGWFDLSIQPVKDGVFILSVDITERKKAENALRESEEKYRLISDNSDDWIYWVMPDGHLRYVSPACERVTGYSPAEFATQPDLNQKIVYPADQESVIQHTDISLLDPTPHQLEFRIVTRDGELRWISHSCSPIFGNNGEYLGRRGTNRNITERKLQQEKLFESEFRFSNLYENGPFGMVMADKEFRFKTANPMFCSILGYTETELKKFTFRDISHPDDVIKDLLNIQKLMNKEISVYRTEKRYIRKDGQVIWGSLTVTPTYDSEGEFLYNLGIIEDISRRKQAEEDLKKSEELLAETESIGKVGGWEFNIDTMEQTWTKEVFNIHEVDLDFNPKVDKGINFYTTESIPVIEKAVQNAIQNGEPFNLDLEIITAKGNFRKVHTIGKADIENRRVYGFFQDITERKQIEEQLRQSEERLSKIFHLGPVAKVITRASDTVIRDFNKAAEQLFGFKYEDVLGKPIDNFDFWLDPADRLRITEIYSLQGFLHGVEFQFKATTGNTGWASIYTEMFEISGEKYLLNEFVDITEHRQAEEKIRELNERIATATRSARIGIWDWDVKNNLLNWDAQMHAIYGLENEKFAGAYEAWISGLHPDDRDFCQNEVRLALLGEKEYEIEFRIVWPDGTVRNCKSKGEVFRNSNGDPMRMVGINYDITEQKKVEEKIREKDMEFRKLSANVPDLIYQFTRRPDGSYCVPIASAGIRNIFGCSPEDVIDDFGPIARVLYPEDAGRVIRDIESSAENMTSFDCEFRVQIPGREIQWIYSRSIPERLPDGSITWYGFNTDITQRKKDEETLRYKDTLLREVGRISQVGGWDFDPVTGTSTWTEEVLRIHDLDLNTPASVSLGVNFYTEKAKPIIEKAFRDVVEKAIPYDLELEIVTASGINKWVRTIGHPIVKDGKVVKVQGSFQDITEKKLADEALRKSEEKFKMLIESIPLPVTYISENGEIIFRNERFLQVFGYTRVEMPTIKEWWTLAYPDESYRQQVIQTWELAVVQAIKNGSDIEPEEYRVTCKDGMERTVVISGIIINGNLLITFIDITDRKKAEEEVRKLNETLEHRVFERTVELETSNKELEAFSYSVSHDLRAPLRHINGYVELLNEKFRDNLPEKALHYLTTVTEASKQMGTLIDDLLQFSRTGRQDLHKAKLDMNVLVNDVLEKIKTDIKNREITWSVQQLPEVFGDHSLLKQVWVNLLENAVKYTSLIKSAEITVEFREEKDKFVFYIRDNGVGFDMKYAHKLFGVFQRLHSQAEFEGTGIGLANVQRIIHKHKGLVWAEAEPGKGATFFFSIPKNQEDIQ